MQLLIALCFNVLFCIWKMTTRGPLLPRYHSENSHDADRHSSVAGVLNTYHSWVKKELPYKNTKPTAGLWSEAGTNKVLEEDKHIVHT